MNQGLKGPTATNLRLDTTHKMFATNPDGTIVLGESTGKRIPITFDQLTGKWWMKVATSMPFQNTKEHKALLADLLDEGAVHFHAEDEHFRGVWIPMEEARPARASALPSSSPSSLAGWQGQGGQGQSGPAPKTAGVLTSADDGSNRQGQQRDARDWAS